MARTPEVEQIAADARTCYGDKFPAIGGKLNAYRCAGTRGYGKIGEAAYRPMRPPCGHTTITIDREPGVTPFIIKCPNCGGQAESSMYRIDFSPGTRPSHEFYRPDSLAALSPAELDHVQRGGLLFREIAQADAEATGHRQPRWERFVGDMAVAVQNPPAPPGMHTAPTIGVAADICPECDTRRVLIACIAPDGREVNVAVSAETAFLIAAKISEAALQVVAVGGNG